MSVFTLSLNHHGAPLDLRGPLRFRARAVAAGAALAARAAVPRRTRGHAAVHLQPHRAVSRHGQRPGWQRHGAAVAGLVGRAGRCRRWQGLRSVAPHPRGRAQRSCASRFPCRRGARFDGARRAADPGPDQGGGARGRAGRHPGHHLAPVVPARLFGRQGGAHPDRHRFALGEPFGCSRAPGPAAVRRSAPGARALCRRRRDDRAGRGPLRRAQAAVDDRGQPQLASRAVAGAALRLRGHRP
jgi:hypothetical protein